MKIYGIKNCTSVRNALAFLESKNIDYEFIDYKKNPPSQEKLTSWIEKSSLESIYNSNSVVFKKLNLDKNAAKDKAIALCQEHPNIIKRPILELENGDIIIGFDKEAKEKYRKI